MISIFGVSLVLYFVKILSGSKKFIVSTANMYKFKGRLHGEISTPGLNSALLINLVEIFCDYMDDPGVETLYYTFSASIPGSKKSLHFVFL